MRRNVTIGLRLLLGGVLLYAAYTKIRDPWEVFAMSVASYGLLPEWAVLVVARSLPWLEVMLGLFVISGYALRYASLATTVLLGTFFAAMLFTFARGLGIDCGCFGPGEALGPRTLMRDGVLLASSVLLTVLCSGRVGRETPKDSNLHLRRLSNERTND
ncbi:MAG: DoxX family membrane protein [Chloroflexi bacterium]|nr:DoxX family membrane protein [Chloroflexota bacterium]